MAFYFICLLVTKLVSDFLPVFQTLRFKDNVFLVQWDKSSIPLSLSLPPVTGITKASVTMVERYYSMPVKHLVPSREGTSSNSLCFSYTSFAYGYLNLCSLIQDYTPGAILLFST